MAAVDIRPLASADRPVWRQLWQDYCAFYGADIAAAVTEATWARLLDPAEPMHGRVAIDGAGRPVGLVHYVLHLNTWSARPVCYLEDLFVAPAARGQGAGRALIAAVTAEGRKADWLRVYWMTKADNVAARTLYDKITAVTDWVRYDVALDRDRP